MWKNVLRRSLLKWNKNVTGKIKKKLFKTVSLPWLCRAWLCSDNQLLLHDSLGRRPSSRSINQKHANALPIHNPGSQRHWVRRKSFSKRPVVTKTCGPVRWQLEMCKNLETNENIQVAILVWISGYNELCKIIDERLGIQGEQRFDKWWNITIKSGMKEMNVSNEQLSSKSIKVVSFRLLKDRTTWKFNRFLDSHVQLQARMDQKDMQNGYYNKNKTVFLW